MDLDYYNSRFKAKHNVIEHYNITLKGIAGSTDTIGSTHTIPVTIAHEKCHVKFVIIENFKWRILIGMDVIKNLKLLIDLKNDNISEKGNSKIIQDKESHITLLKNKEETIIGPYQKITINTTSSEEWGDKRIVILKSEDDRYQIV